VTEAPIKSEYVLAQISQDYWIYVGTKQAGKTDGLDNLFAEAKKEPRPSLLSADSQEPLLFGPSTDSGKVFYAGASKADFLCRLRLLENTDYHWEILSNSKTGLSFIQEDKLPVVDSSLRDTKRIGVRWVADNRQAKGLLRFGNFLGSGWVGIKDGPQIRFEVISAKLCYEEQYLALLRDLTDKSIALLFDPAAPTQGKLIEAEGEQKSPLEKFLLLQASFPLNELRAAMGMIRARPHSQLESDDRWSPASLATGTHAMGDPIGRIRWGMNSAGKPVPIEALERKRRDTTDTAPNRFIKQAIAQFLDACRTIKDDPKQFGQRLSSLASELHAEFEQQSRIEVIKSAGRLGRMAPRKQKFPPAVDPNVHNPLDWHGATLVKPNRAEAFAALGQPDSSNPKDWIAVGEELLIRWNCQNLLLTLGENGMILFRHNEKPYSIPSRAREVYDVSGAGDTVISVLAAGLAAGLSGQVSAELANLAAGIVVGKLGTATVTPEEIMEVARNHG